MSKVSHRLSLGPIPKPDAVKLTITLSAELKAQLDAYAEVHAQLHRAPVDAVSFIPHMLVAFVARDRGVQRDACQAIGEQMMRLWDKCRFRSSSHLQRPVERHLMKRALGYT